LTTPEDGAVLQSIRSETYLVRSNRPSAYFMQRNSKISPSLGFKVIDYNRNRFVIQFDSLSPNDRIIYYANGHFHPIQ